jgi:DHA1 family bicyclomycin/chloramphenicol resistance-like MFS transporter
MQLILRGYRKLLRNRDFLIHSGMLGVAMGLIFVFVTGAPFVIIDMLHVAADRFGYYQASMVLAFFLGSVLASRLADHWQALSLLTVGVVLMLVGTLSLCLVIGFDVVTPLTFTGSFMLMTFGMGPLFAVAPSRALRSIQGQAGTASAMLSSIQLTMAGIAAVLISVMNDGTARPMAVVTVFLGCLLAILLKVSAAEDRGRVSL